MLGEAGKLIIVVGAILIFIGLCMYFAAKTGLPLGRLPGDIMIKRDNFVLYFPLVSCLLVSAIASIVIYFLFRR